MKKIAMVAALAAIFTVSANGQEFQDLNFESAYNLPGNPPASGVSVSVANALPGWTAYGGTELADVYYVSNNFPGASTPVELEGGSLALNGDFSVALLDNGSSISQTGLVPNDAESLQFEASPALNLEVTLGGQTLSYVAVSKGPDYTMYGADIPSGLDGQLEMLIFEINGPSYSELDNIEFSTSSIPEPGEWAFIGLWAAFFAVHRRRGLRR